MAEPRFTNLFYAGDAETLSNGVRAMLLPVSDVRQGGPYGERCLKCEASADKLDSSEMCAKSVCYPLALGEPHCHWVRTDSPDFQVRFAEWKLTK